MDDVVGIKVRLMFIVKAIGRKNEQIIKEEIKVSEVNIDVNWVKSGELISGFINPYISKDG